jgi:hypothetical protein
MMEAEIISETLVINWTLTRQVAREDFIMLIVNALHKPLLKHQSSSKLIEATDVASVSGEGYCQYWVVKVQ